MTREGSELVLLGQINWNQTTKPRTRTDPRPVWFGIGQFSPNLAAWKSLEILFPFSFFLCWYLLFTIVRISCNINTTARTQHTKRGQETLILPSYSWLMGIYGGLEKNWTLDKNDNKPFLNWLIHYTNYY